MNRFALVLFLAAFITPLQAYSLSEAEFNLEQQAKQYALDVVLKSLDINDESYSQSHITYDRHYYTEQGCNSFLAVLEYYTIYKKIFNDDVHVTAKVWRKKLAVPDYQQVKVDKRSFQDKYSAWQMEVPVNLIYGDPNDPRHRTSPFIASLRVSTEKGDAKYPFRVETWYTKRDVEGRQATNYSDLTDPIRYEDRNHPTCNPLGKKPAPQADLND